MVSNGVNDILTGIFTLQNTAKHSMTRMMSPPPLSHSGDVMLSFTSSTRLPWDPITPTVSHGYLNTLSHHRGDPVSSLLPADISSEHESTNNTALLSPALMMSFSLLIYFGKGTIVFFIISLAGNVL